MRDHFSLVGLPIYYPVLQVFHLDLVSINGQCYLTVSCEREDEILRGAGGGGSFSPFLLL